MNRRGLILAGGGAVLAAAAAWRTIDEGVFGVGRGEAFRPWTEWTSAPAPTPLALVQSAVLAASPWNTQPWRFRLDAGGVEVFADTGRNGGVLDPFLRELHLGLGCALENAALAARAAGFDPKVDYQGGDLFPARGAGPLEPAAHIDLPSATRWTDLLYRAVPARRTNRALFDAHRPVSSVALNDLRAALTNQPDVRVRLFDAASDRTRAADLIASAARTLDADPAAVAAKARWLRGEASEVRRRRDGIDLDGLGLAPARAALAKVLPAGLRGRLARPEAAYRDRLLSAPVIGVIAIADRYDRALTLKAGRAWQRAQLWATSRGLAAQACDEAIVLADRERAIGRAPTADPALAALLSEPGWQASLMFRLGYGLRNPPPSPRREAASVLI